MSGIEFGDGLSLTWDWAKVRPLETGWAKADVLYNLQKTMPAAVW